METGMWFCKNGMRKITTKSDASYKKTEPMSIHKKSKLFQLQCQKQICHVETGLLGNLNRECVYSNYQTDPFIWPEFRKAA
jgi:hypothetical protein